MRDNIEMTQSELILFSEIIYDLTANQDKSNTRRITLEKIIKLLRADFGSSYIFDAQRDLSDNGISVNIDQYFVNAHDEYWQFHDPITRLLRKKQKATIVEDVIDRHEFEESGFFNDFLKPNKMHHGINIYFMKDGQDVGDMRIWKEKCSQPFGKREKNILNTLEPYFTLGLPTQNKNSLLTSRESEIATFIQKGFSDKEVSKFLDISHSTVRTHLKHIFEKLGCANRTELATMLHQSYIN